MVEGQTPAPWFVEVNGQKEGPYTSPQIMKLLMDGALKVESRIFDSTTDAWRIAADVIPYLELSAAPPHTKARKTWAPPPRPTELKNVHVVDLNSEQTGEVDYFALINDQRRAAARAQALSQALSQGTVSSLRVSKESASRKPQAPSVSSQGRSALNDARRAETPKIVRVANAETPVAAAIAANPAAERTEPRSDGILVAEVQPEVGFGLDSIILLSRRARKLAREHKATLAIAASLALVFAGTFGTVHMLSDRKAREPASVVQNANGTAAAPALPPNAPALGGISNDPLGHGHNVIHRSHGTTLSPALARGTPPPPSNPNPPSSDAPREPPQYYSSATGDQGVPPPAPQLNGINQAGGPVVPDQYRTENMDPNAGVVSPPNLYQQQAQPDPNDPNRNSQQGEPIPNQTQ